MKSVVDIIKGRLTHLSFRFMPRKKIFSDIYHGDIFGGDESASGPGSSLAQTAVLRRELPSLLEELGASSIIDAPCGDFNWMCEVDFRSVSYIGADIVEDIIKVNEGKYGGENRKFIIADIVVDVLPLVDLILCRDCFVHLSNKDVMRAVRSFKKSGSHYLLTTTFPELGKNVDMVTGRGWRPVNLLLSPFNFPPPIRLLNEKCTEEDGKHADKNLGLWRLIDL